MRLCKNFTDRTSGSRMLVCLFILSIAVSVLTACDTDAEEEIKLADYGNYGSGIARDISARFPYRSPGSEQEYSTGEYLIELLENMGYEPDVSRFTFQDAAGETRMSRNIAVTIPGSGFKYVETDENTGDAVSYGESFNSRVIIGAHYDTKISQEEALPPEETTEDEQTDETQDQENETESVPDWSDYTGIHDNASGVAVIVTLAREMQEIVFGYDVTLVLFGAGEADQAGARHFAAGLSGEDREKTDVMYCIDGIYAGDKIYAHSGWNSLRSDTLKHYENRRKLYEATDVFYEYELYTNNGYMLYTNQSSINVHLPETNDSEASDPVDNPDETGTEDDNIEVDPGPLYQYREWSLHISDYRPFDELGIPIVFFDSGDYDIIALEEMKESNNPAFSLTDGRIRHTPFDSTLLLVRILNQSRSAGREDDTEIVLLDQLSRRINNTAFIILEAVKKGIYNAEAIDTR